MKRYTWTEIAIGLLALGLVAYCTMALITEDSRADDYIDASLGMFHNGSPSPANVKYGEIGHRDSLGLGFFNQYSGGAWIQSARGDGRKSSAFVSDQIGLGVNNGIAVSIATGPTLISTPDSYLGGHFQFHETLFLGVSDPATNTSIGFAYQHFSSAGIEMPNAGKDFGGAEIVFPF